MRFVMLGLVLLGMAGACSLNPQPIPPGAQSTSADAGFGAPAAGGTGDRTEDASSTTDIPGTPADGGTGGPEGGTGFDDAGTQVGQDADAGDASVDAMTDAPDDGATTAD